MCDVTNDVLAAIVARNHPPTVFQRGNLLTRIHVDPNGAPTFQPLTDAALRGYIGRVANWFRLNAQGRHIAISPPVVIVRDLQSLASWPEIPVLRDLVEAPTFAPDGTLLTEPGYHPAAQVWFHAARGLVVPPISPTPSQQEVDAARDLLLAELLGDFPFADDASRAHALAVILLPFARQMIDGLTPLHLIQAPTQGTGKGLLAEVVCIPAIGHGPDVMTEARDDDEWRKRITAALVRGCPFILIDNIRRRLDSGQVAAALTATPAWTDRILGQTLMVTLPVRVVWLATGNNVGLSGEIARRCVSIRLDSKVEQPWKRARASFRHPNLTGWAREHRGQLIRACLTLIQAWIAAGRPKGKQSLGRFESWVEVIGGILDVAGVPRLLANASDLYADADEETREWREFVTAWWDAFHDKQVRTEDLFVLAHDRFLLTEVLGDGDDRSQRTKLGKALSQRRDRVVSKYRIVRVGEDNRGRQQYRLQSVDALPTSADVAPTSRENVGTENASSDADFDDDADFRRRFPGLTYSTDPPNPEALEDQKMAANVGNDGEVLADAAVLPADVTADIVPTLPTLLAAGTESWADEAFALTGVERP